MEKAFLVIGREEKLRGGVEKELFNAFEDFDQGGGQIAVRVIHTISLYGKTLFIY